MNAVGRIVGFNYESLDEKHREQAREHAGKIQKLVERSAAGIVEIGQRLIEVHDALGSRHYQAWLKAEFRWTQATASNYESVARRFGDLDCLNRFNPSALTTLCRANVDPRVIKQAIKLARAGETVTRDRVAKIMRKYLAAPADGVGQSGTQHASTDRPAGSVSNSDSAETAAHELQSAPPARGSLPGVLNTAATDLRSLIRRIDITTIPADQRGTLADELLELAVRLRRGSFVEAAPAAGEPSARPTSRRAKSGREAKALKCA